MLKILYNSNAERYWKWKINNEINMISEKKPPAEINAHPISLFYFKVFDDLSLNYQIWANDEVYTVLYIIITKSQ